MRKDTRRLFKRLIAPPAKRIRLDRYDPGWTAHLHEKDEAKRLQVANPESLMTAVETAVGEVVAFLSHTPDASWGRPGRKRGLRRSLRQEVEVMGDHFDEHIAEIERLLAA